LCAELTIDINWQIMRLKRNTAGVTNLAFHDASWKILFRKPGSDVARDWISDPKIASEVGLSFLAKPT
jgi:hypothetical protein